ncbi:MAG: biotin/lipoyl-binding protein, partial [Proteobacteria bacterium]|nr:biotin/lipoyl-binding protein [Pseudomonadota bacterium]
RHIEVQIFGDHHGHVVALSDRDCSVQRRHQKIIEEAPALGLSAKTRAEMHAAATNLARAVKYRSAGTVEFLVDWSPDQRDKSEQVFYFLEMNTRLQVEHPVTEEVIGEDLVAWQFRVAQGESLLGRIQTEARGHSIELRLYAEDTRNKFLPAPGPVHGFLPYYGPGIRWEQGIDAIDEVTPRFDPMMAKLIATGVDRSQAIQRLIQALHATVLAIPTSNVGFLLSVLHHKGFTESLPTTRYIEEHETELSSWLNFQVDRYQSQAELILEHIEAGHRTESRTVPSLMQLTQDIFKKSQNKTIASPLLLPLIQHETASKRYYGRSASLGRGILLEKPQNLNFSFCQAHHQGHRLTWISLDGLPYWRNEKPDDGLASARSASHDADVRAPVPGKVVKVLVQSGSLVKERQIIAILESMKMEFEVQATRTGLIEEILVIEGQQVQADELLARWRATSKTD